MLWLVWTLYLLATGGLLIYAVNNYVMLFLFRRHGEAARRRDEQTRRSFWSRPDAEELLPRVSVQLPIFNEKAVAERLIAAAGRLAWPRERLEIQVLDDSTDETSTLAGRAVERLRAAGLEAVHVQRTDRTGYKAGALSAGLALATGEFLAVFDADFVPPPDFLRRTVPFLSGDARLACVQARWEHLNADESLLTRAQALAIDGHFGVEQAARGWSGLMFNFNGTAGVWRKTAIEAAGGWQHDTLTEDMDLSYRAQLAGWRMRYAIGASAPAEVPSTLRALQRQQFRWAKGSIETTRKLLGRIVRAPRSYFVRAQALLHLTHYLIHPLMLLSVLAAPWVIVLGDGALPPLLYALCCLGFVLGSASPSLLYLEATRALRPGQVWRQARLLPVLVILGLGLCVNNTRAVLEAVLGKRSGFLRTPKRGAQGRDAYGLRANWSWPFELALGAYALWGCALYVERGYYLVGPYLILYTLAFFHAGLRGLLEGGVLDAARAAWRRARMRPAGLAEAEAPL